MSKIEKVKEIMGLGENFHMCDVSEIAEDHSSGKLGRRC